MFYAFTEFCKYFLEKFPGYYIWPLRLNGSALETIFSQLKFNMNGQLSSVNYPAALTTLKLKRRIYGRRGKFVYRRTPIYVREIQLKRKSRVKWITFISKLYVLGLVVIFRGSHCTFFSRVHSYSTKHSMTCPRGSSECCFLKTPRWIEGKNSLFHVGPVIKYFVIQKKKKKKE